MAQVREELSKEEVKSVWDLKHRDVIQYLNSAGGIGKTTYSKMWDVELSQGNIFLTRTKAERERDKRKAIQTIKKYIHEQGWEYLDSLLFPKV